MTNGAAFGVLGGTFDPVHLGHLAVAREARSTLALARVLLLPCGTPPHKPDRAPAAARHREAMLRAAAADRPWIEVCTLELDAGGVSFTIDTMRRFRDERAPQRPVFVMGLDSLLDLHTWKEYRSLMREFDLLVIDRSDLASPSREPTRPEVARRTRTLSAGEGLERARAELGRGGRIYRLPMEPVPISASAVRRRVAEGRSVDGLVPPAVARYIQTAGLYRREDAS